MMMRFLRLSLAALVAAFLLSASYPARGQADYAGMLYASQFGQWQVPQGNNGPYSWSSPSFCTVTSGGATFRAFTVGTPVRIVDTANPGNSETVIPTAVSYSGSGCSITIHPANAHNSYYLTSGTYGLQEAINYALGTTGQSAVVVLTPQWTTMGGTTGMVTSATGSAQIPILDQRTASVCSYEWSGSSYSFSGCGANALPLSGGTTTGTTNFINETTLAPTANVEWPGFGQGQPIASITVTNGACTSNPSITVPAPANSVDGSQAAASASCVNGQTVVSVTFPGGGYTSSQAATITGGGTSGATATLNLVGTANVADPTGVNDSTAPIENALDYAASTPNTLAVTPQVRLPAGKYLLNEELMVPAGVRFVGDGRNASLLVETNPLAGITVYNHESVYNAAFESYGGTYHMGVVTSLGSTYIADQVQIFGPSGYTFDDIRISGGGGIGLNVQAERGTYNNLEIDQVRQPVILGGIVAANETQWTGLHINGPGESADGYSFGPNSPGGVYPSYNWLTGSTLVSAVGNGSTATFVVQCNSACGEGNGISPIGAGAWFNISGISDVTGLNGIWQAATITNNSPASGQFTIVTYPLETGTFTTPETQEQFTLDDKGMPQLMNASPVTVTGTATGLSGAAFKPVIWPQQNAAVLADNAVQTSFVRSSIKSNWFAGCFQFADPSQVLVSNSYCEGFPINGQPHLNPDVQAGGYLPYTNLKTSLSATNCATLAPCLVGVTQSVGWMNEVNNISEISLIGGGELMDLVCPDYNPASTAACANVPGVLQNQFEVVGAVFLPNGQVAITQRNLSGSTAPSNTAWPAGTHIGWAAGDYNNSPRKALDPGLTLINNHFEDMDLPGAQWYAYVSDPSPMIASTYVTGITPDYVMAFAPGTFSGQSVPHYDTVSINSGFGACSTTGLNINCPKFEGSSDLSLMDTQLNSSAVGAEFNPASIPSLYSNLTLTTTLGAEFVYYPTTGVISTGTFSSPSEGLYVSQACGSATQTNCFSVNVRGVTGGASAQTVFSPGGFYNTFTETFNQTCTYHAPPSGQTHSQVRWCSDSGPYYGAAGNPVEAEEMDTWNGTAWSVALKIPSSGSISGSALSGLVQPGSSNTFTGLNTFQQKTTFGGSQNPTYSFSIDQYGNLCGSSNGGSSCNEFNFSIASGNFSILGGMGASNYGVNGGAQILYRCTGATDTGLVVAGTAGQADCGGASYATAIGFTGN